MQPPLVTWNAGSSHVSRHRMKYDHGVQKLLRGMRPDTDIPVHEFSSMCMAISIYFYMRYQYVRRYVLVLTRADGQYNN